MATTANQGPVAHSGNNSDPFVTNPQDPHRQRYSAFDNNIFSLYTSGSSSQARRALEAHLAETERRLQETSQLGTVLVQQRKELGDRLKEVEQQPDENDIGPELRKKLIELERECNEVSKDTARVFIPKSRVPSGESAELATGGTVFSNDATPSPSKITAPSARKQRNHQVSRIHDIKLATDISSSLLNQLRDVQAALAEKEEMLLSADSNKSKLEIEVEGLLQRLRAMDESEQRYKDENWSLETQAHEYVATLKSTTEREQRLAHTLDVTSSKKISLERELEELRQAHTKLSEDHALKNKHHESEISGLRRTISVGQTERADLQRKVDDLSTQNEDLAKAITYRARTDEQSTVRDHASETEDADLDRNTPDHSPPPSPSKATPRHGQLETETLKTSLQHSHRMIQNLKNNIHREKTEKMELKRLLQDAREELDQRNANAANSAKQKRKGKDVDVFKKPARPERLGGLRSSKEEVLADEPDWEDHDGEESPSRPSASRKIVGAWPASSTDTGTDAFETAAEQSDAFETANEREGVTTETDAFHTGAETLDGDSSDLTETEGTAAAGLVRQKRPSPLASSKPGDRASYMSTASTSADEPDDYDDVQTPVQAAHPKYRLKINRGNRRSTPARSGSEAINTPEIFKDSPASFASDSSQPAKRGGPSLFAELGHLSAEESDEDDMDIAEGTPSRSNFASSSSSPEVHMRRSITDTVQQRSDIIPALPMVDAEVMTEPWEPEKSILSNATSAVGAVIAGGVGYAFGKNSDKDEDTVMSESSRFSDSATWGDASMITQIPTPAPAKLTLSPIGALSSEPIEAAIPKYSIAPVQSLQTEPVDATKSQPLLLGLSSISSGQYIEPLETKPKPLTFATVQSNQQTVPTDGVHGPLAISSIQSGQRTETSQAPRTLGISSVQTLQDSKPTEPEMPAVPAAHSERTDAPVVTPVLGFSRIQSQQMEPIDSTAPETNGHIGAVGVLASDASIQREKESDSSVIRNPEPKSASGFLGSVLGWGNTPAEPESAEDKTRRQREAPENDSLGVAGDSIIQNGTRNSVDALTVDKTSGVQLTLPTGSDVPRISSVSTLDEETQTSLSAEEIDRMFRTKHAPPPVIIPIHQPRATGPNVRSNSSSPRRAANSASPTHDTGKLPTRRPGSAGSSRSRAGTPPPLPPDHREVIAAAQRTSSTPAGIMGPPIMPASAYKKDQIRPRTPVVIGPSQAVSPMSKTGTTPRARPPTSQSERSAPSTRRSSMSSFVSEIDQRFNIPRTSIAGHIDPNNTDPRMIQAITQTMIGEYLWKYTRKAGRGEMSEKRHRRFFWVHPYTRTLYWSEQDPQTAGRVQLKAKSVAIEAVNVVTDDNPMPPGLHRKSIVVITPGRSVKFTATTGQRHETWVNALSYLLLRTNTERDGEENITAEDVDEFNPSYARSVSRQTGRSQFTASSQQTSVTRNASPQRAQYPSLASRNSVGSQRLSSNSTTNTPSQPHNSVSSRLSSISSMFRPGRASFAERQSRSSVRDSSLYEATTVHDSAEDLRHVIEEQERAADRLENVRACCDGKHDVGSLARNGRHSSMKSRHTSFGSMSRSARGRSVQPESHLHHHDEVAESSHDAT